MLAAMDAAISEPIQIVIAGDRSGAEELLRVVGRSYLPNKVLLLADGADNQSFLTQHVPEIALMKPIDGKPAAYVCRNFVCDLPATDPEALAAKLAAN